MEKLSNISITLEYPTYAFLIGVLLIILYTLFIYKITLPKISNFQKAILIALRSISLVLVLWLIFNPTLTLTETQEIQPKTLVFFDNSQSIEQFSDEESVAKLDESFKLFIKELPDNTSFYRFGDNIEAINGDSLNLNFTENSTRLDLITSKIKNEKLVSSVVLISDGIFNNGEININIFNDLNIPFYTLGIGDSLTHKDVWIDFIATNELVYSGRDTEVEVVINNNNAANENIIVQLFSNKGFISEKKIRLDEFGINRVNFNFTPIEAGKEKLTVKIIPQFNDYNTQNNTLIKYIDVLSSKKLISVIAGAPSKDLSIVLNILGTFDEFEINKIVEVGNNKFYNEFKNTEKLNKSDLLILIGYPSDNPNRTLLTNVVELISKKNLPSIFIFSNSINTENVKIFSEFIPYELPKKLKFSTDQVKSFGYNSILNNHLEWATLPPVQIISNLGKSPKIIESILVGNKSQLPVVSRYNRVNQKFIFINAANIWRWKLINNQSNFLLDNLLLNSIKWSTIDNNRKKFIVKSSRRSYNIGEEIKFSANLYDDKFDPVYGKKIILEINGKKLIFEPLDNGIYTAKTTISAPGDYKFNAYVEDNMQQNVSGEVIVNPLKLELLQSKMNKLFLKQIAHNSDGKYFELENSYKLIKPVKEEFKNKIYFKKTDKELRLSNFDLILFFIVLLFSIEWILRKLFRML